VVAPQQSSLARLLRQAFYYLLYRAAVAHSGDEDQSLSSSVTDFVAVKLARCVPTMPRIGMASFQSHSRFDLVDDRAGS
jgi:hypothetical protein